LSKKKILFAFLLLVLNINTSYANEKEKIIDKIIDTNSMGFNFFQKSSNFEERGNCVLVFPGKLKCFYSDRNQKELIINQEKLAVTQKRYNKTYFYPLKKSPFLKILYKEALIKFIKNSKLEKMDSIISLIVTDKNGEKITIFFNNKFELSGWLIKDKFNNDINFSINITETNKDYLSKDFAIPNLN